MIKRSTAGLVVAMGLMVACGVPMDSRPRVIPRDEVPFDLLGGASSPPPAHPARGASIEVFFVRGDRLVPVLRRVPGASAAETLRQLLAGPNDQEAAVGIRSAVAPHTRLLRATVEQRVAVVDLSSEFTELRGEDQILAVAQLVFSVTAVGGVDGVRLLLEGRPVELPTAEGRLTARPLTRSDFATLSP